jgi:hypothetical protein
MTMDYRSKLIDRVTFAAQLSAGRKVLDIGAQHALNHDVTHPFGASYRRIITEASAYEIFDRDAKEGVKYVGDLNTPGGRQKLLTALQEYSPQVILLMEILEHLNYPCEVMDTLAVYLQKEKKAVLFITLPNNGNWILNWLNWHQDHNIAFFKSIAARFVSRSGLGPCKITMYPCMQQYMWYWWIIYILSFGQPFNWGFHITAE